MEGAGAKGSGSLLRLLGSLAGIVGVYLIVAGGQRLGDVVTHEYFLGNLILLGGALSVSLYNILLKRFVVKYGGLIPTFLTMLSGALVLLAAALIATGTRTFEGIANYLERGSDGIEGITFRPDKSHPEGGRFFAVNQFDPPVLVELAVPVRTSEEQFETATIVSAQRVKSAPLSDVLWYPPVDGFLITSALWRSVYVTDSHGIRRRSVRIPGFMQEGIAVLPDGAIVIVQDTGGLLKWMPDHDPFVEAAQSGVKAEEKNEKHEEPQ